MGNMMYADTPLYGSKEEITLIDATAEDGAGKIERIKHPQYSIFDMETDCSSNIEGTKKYLHTPMRIEATTLEIRGSGSYEESFVDSFSFDGYDGINRCIDFLFEDTTNRNSTVIAHNGAGYDDEVILHWAI